MKILLTNRSGKITGKLLNEKLEGKLVLKSKSTTNPINFNFKTTNNDILIRWGVATPVNFNGLQINDFGIGIAGNKLDTRKLMIKKGLGENVPKTFSIINGRINENAFNYLPLVIRPLRHFGGRNFFFATTKQDALQKIKKINTGYASEFINKNKEYRVFCVSGYVIAVTEKIPENLQNPSLTWNHSKGSVFYNVRWDSWPMDVVKLALNAISYTKLDFGAVDIIVKNEIPFFLEINTQPALISNYRITCHITSLNWLIDAYNKFNQKPFNSQQINNWKDAIHPIIFKKGK